jgi:hypothetical protein
MIEKKVEKGEPSDLTKSADFLSAPLALTGHT